MEKLIKCPQCKVNFYKVHQLQKYCTSACRVESHRKRAKGHMQKHKKKVLSKESAVYKEKFSKQPHYWKIVGQDKDYYFLQGVFSRSTKHINRYLLHRNYERVTILQADEPEAATPSGVAKA